MAQQFEPQKTTEQTPLPVVVESALPSSVTAETTQDEATINRLLQQATAKMRRRRTVMQFGAIFPFIGMCYVNMRSLFSSAHTSAAVEAWLLWGFVPSMAMLYAWTYFFMSRPLGLDIEALIQAGGVKALGPLLDAVQTGITPTQGNVIYPALTALLPQLKSSYVSIITPARRGEINTLLNTYRAGKRNPPWAEPLVLAALKALEQVGDLKSIPFVERLALWGPHNDSEARIQQAAVNCLPYLQANAGVVTEQQTLLRPSTAENTSPDTLLRPAGSGSVTDPKELLRPEEKSHEGSR